MRNSELVKLSDHAVDDPSPINLAPEHHGARRHPHITYSDKQVLMYDARKVMDYNIFGMCCVEGSSFGSALLLRNLFFMILIAIVTTPLWYLTYQNSFMYAKQVLPRANATGTNMTTTVTIDNHYGEQKDYLLETIVTFINSLHGILPFFLGLYISVCVSRWWDVRDKCLGGLWGAMDDLCLQLGCWLPGQENKPARDLILRWAVLSHELIYKQIRADMDFSDLIAMGLLTEDENARLQQLVSLPQCVWAWIASYICHLCYGEGSEGGSKIPYPVTVFPVLQALCVKARGCIGASFAYTDTQLPFRYVHFITVSVWVHNVVQACVSGVVFGKAVHLIYSTGDRAQYGVMIIEFFYLVIYPAIYFAILMLCERLSNPLRAAHGTDFPRRAYSRFMWLENQSFFSAGSNPPYAKANNSLPSWQNFRRKNKSSELKEDWQP